MSPTTFWVFDPGLSRDAYVRTLLANYRDTPSTAGHVRTADRRLAETLYRQKVPLDLLKAAFALAACRRIFRDPATSTLAPIQSLHYFVPVLEEIRRDPDIEPGYIAHLVWKLDQRRLAQG